MAVLVDLVRRPDLDLRNGPARERKPIPFCSAAPDQEVQLRELPIAEIEPDGGFLGADE